jgi:hypothetical protein
VPFRLRKRGGSKRCSSGTKSDKMQHVGLLPVLSGKRECHAADRNAVSPSAFTALAGSICRAIGADLSGWTTEPFNHTPSIVHVDPTFACSAAPRKSGKVGILEGAQPVAGCQSCLIVLVISTMVFEALRPTQ